MTIPSRTVRLVLVLVALVAATTAGIGVGSAAAATVRSTASCSTVVRGAPWKIKSLGSGSSYTVQGHGMSCATARAWVVKFSHETETGETVLKGPAGYRCESLASKLSGDTHVYDGECQKGTPASAILVWAPKP
jgi:hypothetical protein